MANITHITAQARELIAASTLPEHHPASNIPFKLANGDVPLEVQKKPGRDIDTHRQFQVRGRVNQQQGTAISGGRILRILHQFLVVVRYAAGEAQNRSVRLMDWAAADSAFVHGLLRQKPVKDKWGAASEIVRDVRLVGFTELTESDAIDGTYYWSMMFAPLYDLEL